MISKCKCSKCGKEFGGSLVEWKKRESWISPCCKSKGINWQRKIYIPWIEKKDLIY